MRVYQAEKNAGIDFQINKAGSSYAYVTAQVRVCDIEKYFDGMPIADIVKATSTVNTVEELLGQDQPDLALVVAILVSTGWNLNDDVFTPDEVWRARNTPLHKPMNDNHQAAKILGHIVQTRALNKDGVEIEVVGNEPPSTEFDIEVAGVLYRAFPELSERINEIITKAKAGEIFVSMEAWFPDFGYGLIDPATGDTKLIERNENTAFLTKHLRIYGGSGEYQGYKIGRVLKNIIFGAQGFVDEPANPESVIKVAANRVAVSNGFVTAELSDLLEGGVEDVDEKEMQELQVKFDEVQTNLKCKEEEVAELKKAASGYDEQIAVLKAKVDELTTNITEVSEKMEVVEAAKAELQKQLDEMTVRAEKSDAELDEIRKNEAARERLAKLSEVKKVDDEEATLAELRDMTEDTFEKVMKYAGEAKSEKVIDEKSEKKTDATETETDDEQAKAILDTADESDDAELNVTDDTVQSESDQWLSVAGALCGRKEEKDEGGE